MAKSWTNFAVSLGTSYTSCWPPFILYVGFGVVTATLLPVETSITSTSGVFCALAPSLVWSWWVLVVSVTFRSLSTALLYPWVGYAGVLWKREDDNC